MKSLKAGDYAGTGYILLGLAVGAVASRAAIAGLHDPLSANSVIKDYKLPKRLVIAAGSVVGSSLIDGKDTMSLIAKGAGYGSALIQILDGASEAMETKIPTTGTKVNKIARASFGLACPDENQTVWGMGRARKRRGMGIIVPTNDFNPIPEYASTPTVEVNY